MKLPQILRSLFNRETSERDDRAPINRDQVLTIVEQCSSNLEEQGFNLRTIVYESVDGLTAHFYDPSLMNCTEWLDGEWLDDRELSDLSVDEICRNYRNIIEVIPDRVTLEFCSFGRENRYEYLALSGELDWKPAMMTEDGYCEQNYAFTKKGKPKYAEYDGTLGIQIEKGVLEQYSLENELLRSAIFAFQDNLPQEHEDKIKLEPRLVAFIHT